jgi:hypothetical protein
LLDGTVVCCGRERLYGGVGGGAGGGVGDAVSTSPNTELIFWPNVIREPGSSFPNTAEQRNANPKPPETMIVALRIPKSFERKCRTQRKLRSSSGVGIGTADFAG